MFLEDIKKRESERCEPKSFDESVQEQNSKEPATEPRKRSRTMEAPQGRGTFLQVISLLLIRAFMCNMACGDEPGFTAKRDTLRNWPRNCQQLAPPWLPWVHSQISCLYQPVLEQTT